MVPRKVMKSQDALVEVQGGAMERSNLTEPQAYQISFVGLLSILGVNIKGWYGV